MNDEWKRATLEKFIENLGRRNRPNSAAVRAELQKQRYSVTEIFKSLNMSVTVGLDADFELQQTERAAQYALGRVLHHIQIAAQQAARRPVMLADDLHRCVWDAARELWQKQHYREAVQTAATAVNEYLQDKFGRRDLSGSELVNEAFRRAVRNPPAPCLRLPGDSSDETVRSRQEGAMFLARACVSLIRNPASHTHEKWGVQESLEMLATLSMFARVIDECVVVNA